MIWIEGPIGMSIPVLAGILLAVGCISMFVRDWRLAVFLIAPFPITMLASGFHKYPFADRLLFFSLPLAYLLIAEGCERMRALLLKFNPVVANTAWALAACLLIATPAWNAWQGFRRPWRGEDITAAMSYVRDHRLETDKIYVYYGAAPAFQYYAASYGFPEGDYVLGISSREDPARYIEDMDHLIGNGRVWFIFSHFCGSCVVNENHLYMDHLEEIGARLDRFWASGVEVDLYDLGTRPP